MREGAPNGNLRGLRVGLAVAFVLAVVELSARLLLPSLAWLDALQPADPAADTAPANTAPAYTARAGSRVYRGLQPGADVHAPFSIGEDGARGPVRLADAATVAIGSSFTFGLGVDDAGTWPALLGRKTGPIANVGLPGMDVAMAAATLGGLGDRLRGKTILWTIQSDDLRRTPARAWLGVRRGFGRFSRAIAWWRASNVPNGAELLRRADAELDLREPVAAVAGLASRVRARVVVIQLSDWGDSALRDALARAAIPIVDVRGLFARLSDPGARTVLAGDAQLNRDGNAALAAAIGEALAR